ncbi:MAG: hypothetical protein ACUVRK_12475 [Spirochaetota bacterium]
MLPIDGIIGIDSLYIVEYETFFQFELTDIQSSYSWYSDDSSYYPDYLVEFTSNNEIAVPQGKTISEFVSVSPDPGNLLVHVYGNTISVSGNFVGKETYTVVLHKHSRISTGKR